MSIFTSHRKFYDEGLIAESSAIVLFGDSAVITSPSDTVSVSILYIYTHPASIDTIVKLSLLPISSINRFTVIEYMCSIHIDWRMMKIKRIVSIALALVMTIACGLYRLISEPFSNHFKVIFQRIYSYIAQLFPQTQTGTTVKPYF